MIYKESLWDQGTRIVDLCGDFENTVDRGSAVVLTRVPDCSCLKTYVRILGPKRNLDHRSFFRLDRYVNKFIQIISFFERSSFKLRCETVFGIVLCVVMKHVAFTIWAKLTVAFTCTSLPLNLYSSVFGCGCGFRFEQKFGWIDGFGEKRARIGGFAYPYSSPSLSSGFLFIVLKINDRLKRKRAPLFHPIRLSKTKTNHDSPAPVFPRFVSAHVITSRFDWFTVLSLFFVTG